MVVAQVSAKKWEVSGIRESARARERETLLWNTASASCTAEVARGGM